MALTSQIRYIRALDSAATTGAGKTGLAFGDFTAKYLVNGGTLTTLTTETITTLGTYQSPSDSSHLRIKEVSSSDPAKGVYEVHFHDTQLATGAKLWLFLSAAGAAMQPLEVTLSDVYDILTGSQSEVAQGAPAANASPLTKLAFLYKAWRNKKTQTASTFSLYNDDAATVDHKATVSDDGTTTIIGEIATGP